MLMCNNIGCVHSSRRKRGNWDYRQTNKVNHIENTVIFTTLTAQIASFEQLFHAISVADELPPKITTEYRQKLQRHKLHSLKYFG